MKLRVLSRLKGQIVCMLAACAVLSVPVGCGSSDEEGSEQEVGLEEGGEAEDGAPLNNASEGENVAENEFLNEAGTEDNFNNFENLESTEGASNNEGDENVSGNGLNNFENEEFSAGNDGNETEELVNNGAGDAFNNEASEDGLAPNAEGEDPFAGGTTTDENGEAVDPFAANAAADPFAADSTAEDPFAADPFAADAGAQDPFADPAVAQDSGTAAIEAPSAVSSPAQGMVPEDGARMAYHIQVGDTLAVISQKIYGNSGSWKTLAQENNLTDANLIYAGDVLFYTLSAQTRGFAQGYESAPRQSVTVQSGDTLSGIASRVLGTQAAWRTLWKENPQITNPDVIEVGMVLNFRAGSGVALLSVPEVTEELLAADLSL